MSAPQASGQPRLGFAKPPASGKKKKKKGLDTNQALLGSERSHSRSAQADGTLIWRWGCSSPPEERHVVMLFTSQ